MDLLSLQEKPSHNEASKDVRPEEIGLYSLPQEILADVIEKIDVEKDLCRLLLCSRRLYNTTLPFLYRDIVFEQSFEHGLNWYPFPPHVYRLYDLTCQVLRNPQIAR